MGVLGGVLLENIVLSETHCWSSVQHDWPEDDARLL